MYFDFFKPPKRAGAFVRYCFYTIACSARSRKPLLFKFKNFCLKILL